ncbi:MAG: hypothetical protein M1827_002915 [Pycnora praestabilis]|nr:MAG: hypothetical protein M1827_002915 [Pycnora praestabilis]
MTFNVHGMSARLGDYETWNNIRRITTEIINSCVANRLDATGGKQVLGNHGNLYMVVYDPRIPDATAREAGLNLSNDREKFNNPISYCRVRREQTTAEMFHLIEGVDESNVKKRSCDECIAQPIKNAQVLFGSGSNLFTDVGSCLPPW